jgi:peptide chain release factor 1
VVLTNAQWDFIITRHQELLERLTDANLSRVDRQKIQKEASHLGVLTEQYKILQELDYEIDVTKQELDQAQDKEFKTLYAQELEDLLTQKKIREDALEVQLAPPDEHDDRSVYLEIRAGAGGQEASLFVADLMKMYTHYASKKNWQISIESESPTDVGGYREMVLHIKGKNAYGLLKNESGVHRVQRVPQTETSGRVHTSTITVAVMPEAKEVEVDINPSDLRIDVFRASGAGGQHVNTTDSAVRITHVPTGVVASCQDERSQHKNKAKAMKMLQSRILMAQQEAHQSQMSEMRKEQVGTGMRAEKVRTYNYPQNRVTDHQVNVTLKKLDMVMIGELDDIIEQLVERDRQRRKDTFLRQF